MWPPLYSSPSVSMTQPNFRVIFTWNWDSLLLACLDGKHWAVSTVSIISPSSSIKFSILNDSFGGPFVCIPASIQHVRLLIEMSIKENCSILDVAFHFSKQYWSVSLMFDYFALCALDVQRVNVWLNVESSLLKESVSCPLWVKTFWGVWDFDEFGQLWNDDIVEHFVDVLLALLWAELSRHFGYFCF